MSENNTTMLSRASTGRTEVRIEIDSSEIAVVDGFCSANGRSRTDVFREMLREWSAKKLHEASVICRVAGVNPMRPESNRSDVRNTED